jgi:hypothetical protein
MGESADIGLQAVRGFWVPAVDADRMSRRTRHGQEMGTVHDVRRRTHMSEE